MPLTNLDQHDGTTGPSLKPDWSFSASPVTFTIFFFLLREEILGLGGIGLHIGNYPNYQLNIPNKIKSKNKVRTRQRPSLTCTCNRTFLLLLQPVLLYCIVVKETL